MRRGLLISLLLAASVAVADSRELCHYTDSSGAFVQVTGRDNVPPEYQNSVTCFEEVKKPKDSYKKPTTTTRRAPTQPPQSNSRRPTRDSKNQYYLAKPDEIDIKGSKRREILTSPLGEIHLRWPRKVELLFGRTPVKAMTAAAQTVNRTIRKTGFPERLRKMRQPWNVVFLDGDLPETQIPAMLIQNCHPGWMTPPANIYIVGQRIAGMCYGQKASTTRVADEQLERVLVHELGHAVEHYILEGRGIRNRMRIEGFASWFETVAADNSAKLDKYGLIREKKEYARQAIAQSPNAFTFGGSSHDYARASMYFHAIAGYRGVRGVMDVYDVMLKNNTDFFSAIERRLNWDRERLEKEVLKVVGR